MHCADLNKTSGSNVEAGSLHVQDHGFKAPVKPGVKFHSLLVVSLGGMGHYNHVINDTGGTAQADDFPIQVTGNDPDPANFDGAESPAT